MPTAARPASTKLVLNPDGSVSVPVKGERARTVVLTEPSMRELAKIHDLIMAANDALPALVPITSTATPEDITKSVEAAQARRSAVYTEEGPHGAAFVSIVNMLKTDATGDLTVDELYGWGMAPRTCQLLLDHFTDPLGGAADDAT